MDIGKGQALAGPAPVTGGRYKPRAGLKAGVRLARKQPVGTLAAAVLLALVVVAALSQQITPYDPNAPLAGGRLEAPSSAHLFGTDALGRDLFSRVVAGTRVSLLVGISTAVAAIVAAGIIGGVSGFAGGVVDIVIQRIVDVGMAIPTLVLVLALARLLPHPQGPRSILGGVTLSANGQRSLLLIGVLALVFTLKMIRIVRSTAIRLRHMDYVAASRALGASEARLFRRHIVPNLLPSLIVLGAVYMGAIIITEASVSFLGLGLPPDVPSWGTMLNDGRHYIQSSIYASLWPGLAIALAVFSINSLGDALRDMLDPYMRV